MRSRREGFATAACWQRVWWLAFVAALTLTLAAFAGVAWAQSGDPEDDPASVPGESSYQPTGNITADLGFRPNPDGFGFENYGGGGPAQDLGPTEMRQLFGPGVCESSTSSTCTLTPPAAAWAAQSNQSMAGGHCAGFAVGSMILFQRPQNRVKFGADTTFGIPFAGNVAVQGFIAYGFTYQLLPAVQATVIEATPKQAIALLQQSFSQGSDGAFTMGISKLDESGRPVAGHRITPFALENLGNGKFNILVYDNNHPGVTRKVEVDTFGDTWSYKAATNPAERSALYQGGLNNKMRFTPTRLLGVQPCPFCDGARADDQVRLEGDFSDHGDLLISDSSGRRLGNVEGHSVDEMPAGSVQQLDLNQIWLAEDEPLYRIPASGGYTVSLTGRLHQADRERLRLVGPGTSVSISNILLNPGQTDRVRVSGDGHRVSYETGDVSGESPTIELGVQEPGADHSFKFRQLDEAVPGERVQFSNSETRDKLTITNPGRNARNHFALTVRRVTAAGTVNFTNRHLNLSPGERFVISYGSFDRDGESITAEEFIGRSRRVVRLKDSVR
jgi:hypothetical protein